ncbi:MAG: hypothetical protein IKS14_07720 [Thermoguttaceae bacterium]|nr:hypothetical protein [Thermoguttaceae bacterium]
MLEEIFCGDAGLAALLIRAFGGEGSALVARNVGGARPLGDGYDAVTVPCAVFSDATREGVSKTPSGRGWDTDAATNALRRRERTAVVLVPAAPLGAAPRVGVDLFAFEGVNYRVDGVETIRADGRAAYYRLACARS